MPALRHGRPSGSRGDEASASGTARSTGVGGPCGSVGEPGAAPDACGGDPVTGWQELAQGVYVRRHPELDLNCGLVVGDGACLVVDTRSHLGEAAALIAAVRSVIPHPWTVVNTHAHYDHCFGNAAFRPATVWGSRGCASALASTAEDQRAAVVAGLRADGKGAAAELVRTTSVDPPDALVDGTAVLDVGGREVVLRFLGRGHTDHDLVVEVEAAGDA